MGERVCVFQGQSCLDPLQSANQAEPIINPELSILIQWMRNKVIKPHPMLASECVCDCF